MPHHCPSANDTRRIADGVQSPVSLIQGRVNAHFLVEENRRYRATPDQRAAAADFRTFLLEPDQQREFAAFGFRALDGRPDQALADTLGFSPDERLAPVALPAPDLLDSMVKAWDGSAGRRGCCSSWMCPGRWATPRTPRRRAT